MNEEIFEAAEAHGYQDDFGRWNFKDDELLDFVAEFYSKDFIKRLIELNISNKKIQADLVEAGERALEILDNRWGDGSQEAIDEWAETADQIRQAIENTKG